MGSGLAGEREMKPVQQHLPGRRGLMGVKIVAQQGVVARRVTRGVGGQPALGRVDFAVLFGLPVLGGDELRAQRHDLGVAGADDDRRDGAVEMGGFAIGMVKARAVGAMNVLDWEEKCTRWRPAR